MLLRKSSIAIIVLPAAMASWSLGDAVTEWEQLTSNAIVADFPTNVYAVNNPSAPVTNPSGAGPGEQQHRPQCGDARPGD